MCSIVQCICIWMPVKSCKNSCWFNLLFTCRRNVTCACCMECSLAWCLPHVLSWKQELHAGGLLSMVAFWMMWSGLAERLWHQVELALQNIDSFKLRKLRSRVNSKLVQVVIPITAADRCCARKASCSFR